MCNVNGKASWVFSVGGTHVYANYKEGTPISYRGFTPPEDKPRTSLDLPTKATLFNLVLMTCYYSEKSEIWETLIKLRNLRCFEISIIVSWLQYPLTSYLIYLFSTYLLTFRLFFWKIISPWIYNCNYNGSRHCLRNKLSVVRATS